MSQGPVRTANDRLNSACDIRGADLIGETSCRLIKVLRERVAHILAEDMCFAATSPALGTSDGTEVLFAPIRGNLVKRMGKPLQKVTTSSSSRLKSTCGWALDY